MQPDADNLPRAGSFLAAAWFALAGYDVSWPLEPCAYDLLVHRGEAAEIGHVLGLSHVNDNNRLMTGNGTANITNPPPDLIATECNTMRASPFTIDL